MYRVEIDTDACDGIFACLTRDDRFAEGDDGLATIEVDAGNVRREDGRVVAEFDDDRLADAEQAARACPPGAISVETVEAEAVGDGMVSDGETVSDGEVIDDE